MKSDESGGKKREKEKKRKETRVWRELAEFGLGWQRRWLRRLRRYGQCT